MSDLYVSSRYYEQDVDYIQLKNNGPITPIIFYEFDDIESVNYTLHLFTDGDRLDQISFKYYGKPDLWWVVAEYNPEIQDFMHIQPGTYIRIPNV